MPQSKRSRIRKKLLQGLSIATKRFERKEERTDTQQPPTQATVTFRDGEGVVISSVEAAPGETVLSACQQAGIDLDHFCGGRCSCGTCRVIVVSGGPSMSQMSPNEQLVLGAANLAKGCRLACQAQVLGPVDIQIPKWF